MKKLNLIWIIGLICIASAFAFTQYDCAYKFTNFSTRDNTAWIVNSTGMTMSYNNVTSWTESGSNGNVNISTNFSGMFLGNGSCMKWFYSPGWAAASAQGRINFTIDGTEIWWENYTQAGGTFTVNSEFAIWKDVSGIIYYAWNNTNNETRTQYSMTPTNTNSTVIFNWARFNGNSDIANVTKINYVGSNMMFLTVYNDSSPTNYYLNNVTVGINDTGQIISNVNRSTAMVNLHSGNYLVTLFDSGNLANLRYYAISKGPSPYYLNASMLDSADLYAGIKTFVVQNDAGYYVEDASVNISKIYGLNNILLSSPLTNVQGQFQLYMSFLTNYNMFVSAPGYENKSFNIIPPYSQTSPVIIQLSALLPPVILTNYTMNYSYINSTGNVTIFWVEQSGLNGNISILVDKETALRTINICNLSTNGSLGQYYCNITGYSGAIHIQATATYGGMIDPGSISEFINIPSIRLSDYLSPETQAILAAIIYSLIILTSLWSPVGVLISGSIGMIFIFLLQIFGPLTLTILIIDIIISIVISTKVGK